MSMSSLNVAEWSADQVADWLSGLGPTVARYVPAFRERGLDGAKLLTLRCDDLEYLGMHVIGHQELLLEAVEHLRNFQYDLSRECVQQLALRVSVVATTLARALRHHTDARLDTQTLADVARTVHAVKPLVCWLDRWPLCSSNAAAASLAERKAALLKLSLEAATCAQRDRFAEQPARQVAAAAATTAATADYIIQDVSDPMILQPASLDTVCLRQGGRPLGFDVVPSFCGHHQLADIRFGSPAHASGAVHIGDEIVQVGGQCVIGWSGEAVVRLCASGGSGELSLRLRRRGARPPPALATPQLHARQRRLRHLDHFPPSLLPRPDFRLDTMTFLDPLPASPPESVEIRTEKTLERAPSAAAGDEPASSSDESEPLSPPASPTRLDHTRMYPPKPRAAVQRRHTVSGATPRFQRAALSIHQFWQELRAARWGEAGASLPETDDVALYARDKAVSCSTGLERSPRPRTCVGVEAAREAHAESEAREEAREAKEAKEAREARAKLDKSHSTPAYDFGEAAPSALAATPIPESPADSPPANPLALHHDKADRILDFKKSSSQIGEAILQQRSRRITDDKTGEPGSEVEQLVRDETTTERILETINIAMMEHRRRSVLQRTADNVLTPASEPETVPSPEPRNSLPRSAPSPPPRPRPVPPPACSPPTPSPGPGPFPILRAVSRAEDRPEPPSPLKPHRPIDAAQISVPLRHITKHDILVVSSRRELPALNGPAPPPPHPAPKRRDPHTPVASPPSGEIVVGAEANPRGAALSPSSAVRGIFPSSKTRSLKKKSSILAKRRCVSAPALAARSAAGAVWQRVRARAAQQPRWARRHLLLTHNLLYAYRTPECAKADCMIYLEGFTVSAAGEVKSRPHAFKVYHAHKTFYFASDTRDAMLAWIQLIHRATLLPSLTTQQMDVSKQFSETDYSETESDTDSPHRERDKDRDKEKEKDKSKFGSLKKLTVRMQRSESQENVPHSSTSLDRKYLRFFSRNKTKDDTKVNKSASKTIGVPIPTEHYRSYRRVPAAADERHRPAEPLHYIHASNPNLLELDTSDLVPKPTLRPRPKPKESLSGLVTLEQFMLDKQAEERRQLYSNRVLLGVETRDRALQRRLDNIVPDVIYGEVGPEGGRGTRPRDPNKPISVKGKDGYEKIVYPDEAGDEAERDTPGAHERWRDSLRRNDKVHTTREPESSPNLRSATQGTLTQQMPLDSWSGAAAGVEGPQGGTPGGPQAGTPGGPGVSRLRLMFSGGRARDALRQSPPLSRAGAQYAHLQCPPTFQPETYSLARLGPRSPRH